MITALVVDDDVFSRKVLSDILEFFNIEVIGSCNNGFDANSIFCQNSPTVTFMDIIMPEYDGFYGIEEITKTNPEAKIVAITDDITIETQERLKLLKIPILYKPYKMEQIKQVLIQELKIKL